MNIKFCVLFSICCFCGAYLDAEDFKKWIRSDFSESAVHKNDLQRNKVTFPFDWSCTNIVERSVCYRLHGFTVLDPIVTKYETARDAKCGEFIHDFVVDWLKSNPVPLEGHKWAWHDDATARRVQRMSYYFKYLKNLWLADELEEMKASLDLQAELLAKDSFYTKKHNHGMYQDFALLSYAICVCTNEIEAQRYRKKAIERSMEYFDYVFCENGVHKEHSPMYANWVADKALAFSNLVAPFNVVASKKYYSYYCKAQRFLVLCTKPNGMWPAVGDSREVWTRYEPEKDVVFRDEKTGGGVCHI